MSFMVILQLPIQSVPITTKVVHGKVYLIQHYVIKFVGDLRQVGGFLWLLQSHTLVTDHYDITEILLKVALNTITLTLI
jgi:hypothetical protein